MSPQLLHHDSRGCPVHASLWSQQHNWQVQASPAYTRHPASHPRRRGGSGGGNPPGPPDPPGAYGL